MNWDILWLICTGVIMFFLSIDALKRQLNRQWSWRVIKDGEKK